MRAEEDAGEAVIILGRDRVELVVVAAGARHGQAHDGTADDVELIVGDVGEDLVLVGVSVTPVADGEHRGGDRAGPVEAGGAFGRVSRREEVARDLIADELVVGHVRVQGLRDPVAVAPGVEDVAGLAGASRIEGVGVADHVEPMPSPALSVGGRRQQAVDHAREGVGRFVLEERLDLAGRRRQAREVERRAADQGPRCRPRARDGGPSPRGPRG